MRSFTLTPLLLLLLLLAPATASQVQFLTLSRRLTRLRGPQICAIRRDRAIGRTQFQLSVALKCLSADERRALGATCATVPATPASTAACEKLAACPSVSRINERLRAAEKEVCPLLSERLGRLERRWRTRLNRRIRRAGLPKAVYDTIVLEPTAGKADSAVVILHGVGDLATNRLPLAALIQDALPKTRVILPQAPEQFVDFFNVTMESWFNIFGNTLEAPQAVDEIIAAANGVSAIADVQTGVYGIPRERVGILGISQGGAVALTTYLRHKWGAAVGAITYLPLASSYPEALAPGSEGVELLMVHGRRDQVVPFPTGKLSRDLIRGFGRKVRWVELKGGHNLAFEQDRANSEIIAQFKAAFG